MGCAKSSVRPPIEQQEEAARNFRRISVPSPLFPQPRLPASSGRGQTQTSYQPNVVHIFQPTRGGDYLNPLLTDQRILARSTFDYSGQKASVQKTLNKQSVSTDIANMSNKELERINDFLNYLDREELCQFKRRDTEVNDIKDAIGKAVDSFGNFISEKYPLLVVSHKHAVGSVAEGTRLKERDEFDFILVLGDFNEKNVSVERCMQDCIDKPKVRPHAHIKIKKSEWWNAKAAESDKWQDNGLVCNWLDFVDNDSFTRPECEWNVNIETPSGKLSNSEKDLRFTIHGPAFTFELLWISTHTNNPLKISIDASLALEKRGVTDVIDLEDAPCQEFIPDLLKEDM